MRLLIISHTPHYLSECASVGLGATVREIDHLATIFDSVTHLAPLHPGQPPADSQPYRAGNVRLRPVRPAGGERIWDKAMILGQYPAYAKALREEVGKADAIHVRCPANISLCALTVLAAISWRGPLWVKYAGSWTGYPGEPLTYSFQRHWLQARWRSACVTTNGTWPGQPEHVHSLYNPCLTDGELDSARDSARERTIDLPIRLLFVGRVDAHKGVPLLLEVARALHSRGLRFSLEIAGDGPSRAEYEGICDRYGLAGQTKFLGWLARPELSAAYRRAHLIVLPSKAEGWPKVLSEAMAHGVVPIASRVGSVEQNLRELGVGAALDPQDGNAFVEAILGYVAVPDRWRKESRLAAEAAARFSYSAYLSNLVRLGFGRPAQRG